MSYLALEYFASSCVAYFGLESLGMVVCGGCCSFFRILCFSRFRSSPVLKPAAPVILHFCILGGVCVSVGLIVRCGALLLRGCFYF